MSDDPKQYPRGQVSLGQGELRQATSVEIQVTSNAKVIHTLRTNGAGFVQGNVACTFTLDTVIDEDGEERDWIDLVLTGKPLQCRIKVPGGKTKSIKGIITGATYRLTLEDGVQVNVSGVGVVQK